MMFKMNTYDNVKSQDYYNVILEVMNYIKNTGLLERGSGYCFSMSDIISKLLSKEGIESELVECNLMVMRKSPPGLYLIGYPGFAEDTDNKNNTIQNHVVCITKTPIPILIDASLNYVDSQHEFICEPIYKDYIKGKEETTIAEFEFENSSWNYQKRSVSDLPILHQKSIIDRIKTDIRFEKELRFLKKFLYIMFTVSFLNFSRGMYDFYLTFIKQPQVQNIHKIEHTRSSNPNERSNF